MVKLRVQHIVSIPGSMKYIISIYSYTNVRNVRDRSLITGRGLTQCEGGGSEVLSLQKGGGGRCFSHAEWGGGGFEVVLTRELAVLAILKRST